MINHKSFTFFYLILSLIFGVLLYDFLLKQVPVFTFIDEILVLLLGLYSVRSKYSKETKIFLTIFLFYVVYSLQYGVAIRNAVVTDALIFLKPFLTLYIATSLNLQLSTSAKRKIRYVVLFLSTVIFFTGVVGREDFMFYFFGHPSRFATFFEIMGFTYIYCSARKPKDVAIMFLLFAGGLLSMRSKCYGFVAVAFFLVYFIKKNDFYKISMKNIVLFSLCIMFVLIFIWEKWSLYFVEGVGSDAEYSMARPALYMTCIPILKDYFPFGPGFGSYACYASGQYYSPIYTEYHLNRVFGLSIDYPYFISDTFFPQIVQFGIVGVFLFFLFFKKRYSDGIKYYTNTKDKLFLKINILFILFFLIESSTDSTFVQNRGMGAMFIWALFINEKTCL